MLFQRRATKLLCNKKYLNDTYDISIENLETKTKYYIRTFLINNEGEFYGLQSSLPHWMKILLSAILTQII